MSERTIDSHQTRTTWVERAGEEELYEASGDRDDHANARGEQQLEEVAGVVEQLLFHCEVQQGDRQQAEHGALRNAAVNRGDKARDEQHEEPNERPRERGHGVPVAGQPAANEVQRTDEDDENAKNCRWLERSELICDEVVERWTNREGNEQEPLVPVEPDDRERDR